MFVFVSCSRLVILNASNIFINQFYKFYFAKMKHNSLSIWTLNLQEIFSRPILIFLRTCNVPLFFHKCHTFNYLHCQSRYLGFHRHKIIIKISLNIAWVNRIHTKQWLSHAAPSLTTRADRVSKVKGTRWTLRAAAVVFGWHRKPPATTLTHYTHR